MADSTKTETASENGSENTGFNCPCCDSDKMKEMMKNFSGDKKNAFDCNSMMQMCFSKAQ